MYQGNNKLSGGKEHVSKKGYAAEFEELLIYINSQLPTNELIEQALRKTIAMYPEVALRELVANAIIHQDFLQHGTSPMVEIFNDRIEISNPGSPLIDPLRFIDHSPVSRNEKIASMMRRMAFCEERGSGIDKVISLCELYQLPAPQFIKEETYTRAILYAHRNLSSMDKEDKIRACYQHCCLKYHVLNEKMTNQSLRKRLQVSEENQSLVSRIIKDTIGGKLVKAYDPDSSSRRFACYVPFWA